MEEILEQKLLQYESQIWWTGFIHAVVENQNAGSFVLNPNPIVGLPAKTLYWALTTAAELLDVSEVRKKDIILNYVTDSGDGMYNFFELFADVGTLIPIGAIISAIIREFVNPRNGTFKQVTTRQMILTEPTEILFNTLDEVKKAKLKASDKESVGSYHAINVNTIWIISSLAKKDPNFVNFVVEFDKIKFIHEFIKKNFFHPRNEIHYPCLKILRALAKVSKVGHLLGKDKFFTTLRKMMELYLTTPSTKFQMVLELLVMLTRNSRAQCKRFLKAGCLISVMRVFNYWPVWKGRGLLKMSKCVLNVYLQLATTYAGRKSLIQTDALHNVRQFCENCPNDKQYDEVITRACAVNSLTYGKHKLPFKDISSPVKFEFTGLSPQDKVLRDSGTSSDEDDPDDIEEPRKPPKIKEEDDDDDGDDLDSEIVVSDIELDEGNLVTDDEDVTLKESSNQIDRSRASRLRLNEKTENWIGILMVKFFITMIRPMNLLLLGFWENSFLQEYRVDVFQKQSSNIVGLVVNLTIMKGIYLLKKYVKLIWLLVIKDKMMSLMQRTAGIGLTFKPIVLYDLDSLLRNHPAESKGTTKKARVKTTPNIQIQTNLGNEDELNVGQFDKKKRHSLKFESRFEGGNLRKAIQVGDREYDLYLMSDVNSSRHNQWFYFQVSNTSEDMPITFNIVNCIKANSQFNFGMQPVVFSVMDALDGRPGWIRAGTNAMYYRNGYRNPTGKKRKYYYSAAFTLTFAKKGDICYIAYHYPYSYSRLLTELWKMTKIASEQKRLFVRYDMLCHSENENEVPLMTITALNDPRHPVELREIIFLTSRVHPGEPNSSWVMHGILHQLIFGSNMDGLLKRYIFKIVPMLNVEGVINGCGRCGLTDEDLNRLWKNPNPTLHPSIFHTKALIEYSCKVRNKVPILYCDLHGHSRRKNVFFYGCSLAKSWYSVDRAKPDDSQSIQILPDAMSRRAPAFSLQYCKYDIRKQRESTARVALWREFGITKSYTLESSYCGCDRGPYKGVSIGIGQLLEIGESLCGACEDLHNPPVASVSMFDIQTNWDDVQQDSKMNLISFEDARNPSFSNTHQEEKDSFPSDSSSTREDWNKKPLTGKVRI